jgi:two-component system LytT family response regulator
MASNKEEAIEKIKSLTPDLIFMDIKLGKSNGFDVLDECKSFYKYVIFTTSYDKYAIKGYNYNVVHYLLKPIEEEQLAIALEKVSLCLNDSYYQEDISKIIFKISNLKSKKIFFPDKNVHHAIEIDSIIYIESAASYSNIYTINRTIKISKNLSYMQNLLSEYPEFIRVHRSYIINRNHIINFKRGVDSSLTVTNNYIIPISINEKDNLFKILGIKD